MPIHAALLSAVQQGKLETVKELVQVQEVKDCINETDEDGNTILHHAIKLKEMPVANMRSILRALEGAGANIEAVNKLGSNAFIEAIRANNEEFATWLLQKITESKPALAAKFVNQLYGTRDLPLRGDGKGYNALHATASRGYSALLKAELVAGANIVSDANGWSPLHDAVQKGIAENVKLLVEYKADVNQAAGKTKRTPLSDALKYYRKDRREQQLQIIKILLEAKPELNQEIVNDVNQLQKTQVYALDSCRKARSIDSALFSLLVPAYISLDVVDGYLKKQPSEVARLFKFELDALRPQVVAKPQASSSVNVSSSSSSNASAAATPTGYTGLRQRFTAMFPSNSSSSANANIQDDEEDTLLEMQPVSQANSLNI